MRDKERKTKRVYFGLLTKIDEIFHFTNIYTLNLTQSYKIK